jgi:hypothetical protein
MKKFLLAMIVVSLFTIMIQGQTQDESEHPQFSGPSDEFVRTLNSSVEALNKANFEDGLETPGLAAVSSQDFEKLVAEIRKETPIDGVSEGERGVKYDVILQPGHYGRVTGRIGTTGQRVSERALAAYITNILAQRLRADGDSVLVVSADRYLRPTSAADHFDGLTSKVFLAIHLDGNVTPCTGKASLAYPSGSLPFPMHAVGFSLATALGYNYMDFARDNYTPNEGHYYMFSQVRADRLAGLLEVGELTCPEKEKLFITSSDAIGEDIAYALNFIIRAPDPIR